MPRLIVVLFFVSGATALVGQVVWMRMLGLVLGNTVWAASAAVAVWMGGMAVGSWVGARLASFTRRHLCWYGAAEAVIGLFYGLSPGVHEALLRAGAGVGEDLGSSLGLGLAQRMGLAVLALALPTILMGLTLPLLVERARGTGLAARVSLLYGVNTFGAAIGVLCAAYLLLPRLGERASLAAAGLMCAVVAAVAIMAERRVPSAPGGEEAASTERTPVPFQVLVAAMGFSALAAELVWVRVLVLHLGSRVYAFAILLGVYLLGIATGSLLLRLVAARLAVPARALARAQVVLAFAIGVQVLALGHAGDVMAALTQIFPLRATFTAIQGVMFAAVALLFFPVTVLFGASFPLAVASDPSKRGAGAHTGAIAAANTVGGIAGALCAPFVLVPLLGCQRTLLLLVVLHGVVAVALHRTRALTYAVVVAVLLGAGLWVGLAPDWILRRAGMVEGEPTTVVEIDESLSATVLVKEHHDPAGTWLSLELNGVNVAGSDPALLAVQQLQGNLPLLQVERPSRVLHVGFGSGGTCWAVSRHPVTNIDVVEIAPEVLRTSDTFFRFINRGVLDDPRVRAVINDGRNYLLATDTTYDAILSDSIHPVFAGNSTLYTREYFQMCRDRLEPGGVVSMWLPLYSLDGESFLRILRAFHDVFPRTAVWYDVTTVNEFTVVTGMVKPGGIAVRWQRLADPRLAETLEIAGIRSAEDLMADLLLGPAEVGALTARTPPLEDDLPFVEYTAGRLLARTRTWRDNLALLYRARARSNPFAGESPPWAEAVAVRDEKVSQILRTLDQQMGDRVD